MTHHNHANEYMVHGVSYELLRGNEDTMYSPVWFIESDGSYYWTREKSWTKENLRKVNNIDEEFIYFFQESERVPLSEGEIVYLAGNEFMNKILSFVESGSIEFSMGAWKEISNGYYVSAMTQDAFHAFAESLCLNLWAIVETYLTDTNSVSKDIAMDAFDAYSAISFYSSETKRELSVRRAMVYLCNDDADRLKVESYLSVDFDKFFDTAALFHNAAAQRLDALKQ